MHPPNNAQPATSFLSPLSLLRQIKYTVDMDVKAIILKPINCSTESFKIVYLLSSKIQQQCNYKSKTNVLFILKND